MKIIDTPGLIDAPEKKMEDKIKKFVWMSAPGPHVFLLVIKLDTRLTNEEKNTERWILENIGERALDHTVVLFTHADRLRGKSLDEYIRERRFLQLLVVGCGGRFHSFNNQDRDDNNQVTELLEKIENTAERNEWRYYTNEKFEKMIEREQFIENIKQNLNKVAVGAVPNHINDPKIIFREEKDSIKIYSSWKKKERFIISDEKHKNIFSVRITAVTPDDGGVYLCGVWINRHSYSYYIINTVYLHIMDAKYPTDVIKTAYLGEEVSITCQIPEKHKVHFCKEDDNHICQNISSSKVTQMIGSSERNEERVFTVIISNVSVRDAGVYWCGAETRDTNLTFISLTTKIQLNITMPPVVKHEGESAEIICPYDSIYKSKSKSLCKGKCSTRDRNTLNETVREEKETKTDRLTLNDDVTASVFTGTITGLTAEDAGKYWCAVTLERDLNYLYTHLIVIMNEELNLTKYEGDDVSIQCKHQDEDQKSFCKAHEASMCVKDGVSLETIRDDRFSFSDEASTGVFTVNITDLREEDSGIYWCGAHVITKVSLTVKKNFSMIIIISVCVILLLMGGFTLTVWKLRHKRRAKVGVSRVSGYTGGGLMIKCEHPQYKTKPKYICKESDGCSERKNPGVQDEWMENGDVSLYDDTRAGGLMVFFRELKAADAGTYRCGVNVSHYTERFTELQLNVKHDAKYPKSMTESAHLGEEINITCQIPEEHEVHFCKEDDNHICQNISSSKVTQMNGSSERNEERVFTVIISNVSVRDAGVYWCGAETRDTYLTFISLNTKIQLNIIMAQVVRHEGESAEIICPYDSIYKSKSKSLCKGKCSTRDRNTLNETVREEKETKTDRLTLNDDVTASVFTGTITGLTAEDAGKYWCAVTLERDLNYLYTHLIVIMNEELNLTKYEGNDVSIQCKHQDEDQKSFCKAHEASMCVKDGVSLETIRDDRFSFSDEASTGVFTVNITDLREEDSGIYWCGAHVTTKVNLTVKKDFSMIIIISVCVILLLMGGFTLTVWKLRHKRRGDVHSHLPTSPSDGLLYAAVSFQKREESLSDATVRFSKDEIYSDYAAVSHRMRLN
ncbi:polymeric immunoglobulin receptor-like protein [Labeo rohita]|nr:polymeric immunoglobulin receptor-like protein [Labeo rohita]